MCLVETSDLQHASGPFFFHSFDSSRLVEMGEEAVDVDVIMNSEMLIIDWAIFVRVSSNDSRARTLTRKVLEPAHRVPYCSWIYNIHTIHALRCRDRVSCGLSKGFDLENAFKLNSICINVCFSTRVSVRVIMRSFGSTYRWLLSVRRCHCKLKVG